MDIILLTSTFSPMTREQRLDASKSLPPQAGKSAGSICSWQLLLRGLKEYYGLTNFPATEKADQGKPYFPERGDICFSLSHTDGRAVCAIYDSNIGCDIEKFDRPILESLINRTATAEEKRIIAESSDPKNTFLRFWTLKEAVLKKRGDGLAGGIFDLDMSGSLKGLFRPGEVCTTIDHLNYLISVCAEKPATSVIEIKQSDLE